jgi:hypothetical protein
MSRPPPASGTRGSAPYARLRLVFFGIFVVSTASFLLLWFLGFAPAGFYGGSPTPATAVVSTSVPEDTATPAIETTSTAAVFPTGETTGTPLPGMTSTAPPYTQAAPSATPAPAAPEPPANASPLAAIGSLIAIATSCLTSFTTFIGFVVTTAIGLRKEKRETRAADLERLQKELDLEKQRLELEKQRAELEKLKRKQTGQGEDEHTDH